MANRSRLGRDPLQTAPKPSAAKPAAARRKPAVAKGDASADTAKKQPAAAANKDGHPLPVAQAATSPDATLVAAASEPSQTPADAAIPTSLQARASETASPAQPPTKSPESVPYEASGSAPEAHQPSVRSSAPDPDQPPVVANKPTAAPAQAQEAAAEAQADAVPASSAAALGKTCPAAGQASGPGTTCPAACPGSASPALSTDAHPVAVFLRGVLEGLLPEGEAALCVDVDESTSALPVEKLFYFSHALQRIAMPLENAASADWRPGAPTGPLPVLTARLRPIGRGRHSLTLFDNGCFFTSRLPGLSLGMEALTPLTAFVAKRQGSILLARGRVTAFEIIG